MASRFVAVKNHNEGEGIYSGFSPEIKHDSNAVVSQRLGDIEDTSIPAPTTCWGRTTLRAQILAPAVTIIAPVTTANLDSGPEPSGPRKVKKFTQHAARS